ncbi:MAG: Do family serine endopeptidase [Sphingobacteriales bacterium JAD_PAG50586_3]|nr:MAG: Do family serine endopeptidase [Sphingobacteriales bacterium JAD_PAG50586_3]
MKKYIVVFAAAAIGGFTSLAAYKMIDNGAEGTKRFGEAPPTEVRFTNATPPESGIDFTTAADLSVHAVVHVKTTYERSTTNNNMFDPFRDFFGDGGFNFQMPNQGPQSGSGSGVIISEDGYIITNNHVVDGADKVDVTLNDNRSYKATVIGVDPTTDLALIKVNEKGLPFLAFANSDDVKVGQWVLAVGNPFNLTSTVTAGIVSAKGRNINILENNPGAGKYAIESFIQTDAAVNPGNSGGALVNTKGELVGINTAIASQTGSYAGYSFAIPVNIVRKVANDLLEFGEVQRAFLGVSIQNITSDFADDKGLKTIDGVYISDVAEDGSAKDAGLQIGDVILKINGVAVNSTPALQEQVARNRPGDKITVTYRRGGTVKDVSVTLKNKNGGTTYVKTEKGSALGADFEVLSKEEKAKLKITNGVKVTKIAGGRLRSYGIKEGFVITEVNSKPINSIQELQDAFDNAKGRVMIRGIYPDGTKAYYSF